MPPQKRRPNANEMARELFIQAVSKNPIGSNVDPERFAAHSFRMADIWVGFWKERQMNPNLSGDELIQAYRKRQET